MAIQHEEARSEDRGPDAMSGLSRRAFLRWGGGTLTAAAVLPLLAACTSPTPATSPTSGSAPTSAPASTSAPSAPAASPAAVSSSPAAVASSPAALASPSAAAVSGSPAPAASIGGVQLPAYVPFKGPQPDFPPSADGIVPAGYNNYPKNIVKATNGQPIGNGETVNFVTYSINPPPPPVAQNPAWQQVNKNTGLNITFPTIALADYNTKLPTLIAGGELPDMFTMNVLGVQIPNELQFFQSQCADLTPYVAGDAIKDYPNLANFPTLAWKNCIYNGKFYALPRLTNSVGNTMYVQQNLLDDAGIKQISSADDFTAAMKALTRNNMYGIGGSQATSMQWFLGMFGAPNKWRLTNGKLTKDWETPEYKQAVAYMRSLWDAGYVSPDTPSMSGNSGAAPFYASKYAMYPSDYFAFAIAWNRVLTNPNFKMSSINVPAAKGGGPGVQFQGPGINQITVLKKADPARIKQLLSLLNYLASPFGTEEYQLLYYGVQGTDFQLDANGNPALTKQGQQDVQYMPWGTIISPPAVLYNADSPGFTAVAYPKESAAHQNSAVDPTIGVYSQTDATKGAVLTQAVTDGVNQILFGRADVNSLDQLVQTWQNNGGNTIRSEYEQGLAALNG